MCCTIYIHDCELGQLCIVSCMVMLQPLLLMAECRFSSTTPCCIFDGSLGNQLLFMSAWHAVYKLHHVLLHAACCSRLCLKI